MKNNIKNKINSITAFFKTHKSVIISITTPVVVVSIMAFTLASCTSDKKPVDTRTSSESLTSSEDKTSSDTTSEKKDTSSKRNMSSEKISSKENMSSDQATSSTKESGTSSVANTTSKNSTSSKAATSKKQEASSEAVKTTTFEEGKQKLKKAAEEYMKEHNIDPATAGETGEICPNCGKKIWDRHKYGRGNPGMPEGGFGNEDSKYCNGACALVVG